MKGIQHVEVSNRYAKYKFDLRRNITIVRGESGTGKTTLYNMIADYSRNKEKSGVNLSSTVPCYALTDINWEYQLANIHDGIVFIDEDAKYISSVAFAEAAKQSGNYFVIFNRESLHNLPYSVNEIYEIKTSGKHHSFVHAYVLTNKYALQVKMASTKDMSDTILTEDSNSGYQFFSAVAAENGMMCVSSNGNASVFRWLKENPNKKPIMICDGAAFGSEIDRVSKLINSKGNCLLWLPESFEWLILMSGAIKNVEDELANPSSYVESAKWFSWEKYFEALLIEKTNNGYLKYEKAKLNKCYLQEKEMQAIMAVLPAIKND